MIVLQQKNDFEGDSRMDTVYMGAESEDAPSERANEKYLLQSVEKAGQVLELFYEHSELGASEVAAAIHTTRGTAFRFLVTLEHMGYLIRTDKAKYRLGLKIYTLGQIAYSRFDLINIAHPILEQLMEETGESSFLAISDGLSNVIYVDRVVCRSTLRIEIPAGGKFAAHCTAVGKAILAFQSDAFIEQYLMQADYTPLTDMSITSPEMLTKELAMIKKSGFSQDNQESEMGLSCYGAPVLDNSGYAVAGISICGPLSRMNYRAEEKIGAVKQAAAALSQKFH